MSNWPIHPAANAFPLMDDKRFAELVADIQANGLRLPIVIYDGQIIDGRNRLKACSELGIEPTVEHASGDPWALVWSLNGSRRDLEAMDRYLIFSECMAQSGVWQEEHAERQAKANAKRSRAASEGKVGRAAAKKKETASDDAEFSPATRSGDTKRDYEAEAQAKTSTAKARASGTNRGAVEKGDRLKRDRPDLAEKVLAGELTGAKAYQQMKTEQREKELSERTQSTTRGRVELRHGDAFSSAAAFSNQSIDLLLTDPPYSTDVDDIEAFATWLNLWLPKVKTTGRAYIFIGAYPDELRCYLNQLHAHDNYGMTLDNVLVWTYRNTIGPSPKQGYKLNWQACLYLYGKDASALDCPSMLEQFTVQEVNAPDARTGVRFHAWQKPDDLATRLIAHSTKAGDLVVDPFCGTGTFVAAAATVGRHAIGIDKSTDMLELCRRRGLEVPDAA